MVEWRVLPGSYNSEYPGANLYEAKCVVDELVSFAMSESKKSIGVIASTVEQKKLILRLFAQKLRHQEDLAEVFSDYKRFYVSAIGEAIFPCDKLIFSATFAADRSLPGSRLDYSILEFASKDPIKAIGSMLSSAKEQILILSSFKHEELSFSPTLLPVNTAFTYLFDALSVPKCNRSFRIVGTGEEVSVVRRVRQELENRGYKTLSGVQNGRYYIDLAVLSEKGDFVLGIISDHTVMNYQANIAAIEIANLDYYKKSGWQIFRLHSAFCFDSFESELQKILDILQNNESSFGLV